MKRIAIILILLTALYSIILFLAEMQTGQDQVRGYFSDITTGTDYPLPVKALFGINTTLSVLMLSGCALLFAVCSAVPETTSGKRRTFFHVSQIVLFLYLAMDERLLIHERLESMLGFDDSLQFLGLGVLQLILLLRAGAVLSLPLHVKGWLIPAGVFFIIMAVIDTFVPEHLSGRLAAEDLSKIWACLFLLVFSWAYCINRIPGRHTAAAGDPRGSAAP